MDIIDIMLARALTPQGQTETYVSIANAAAEKAEKAEQDAAAAIATVDEAADEIAAAKEAVGELPEAKRVRYKAQYGMSDFDVETITSSKDLAMFFEDAAKKSKNPKRAVNLILAELLAVLNEKKQTLNDVSITPAHIAQLADALEDQKITSKQGKEVFAEMLASNKMPADIIKEKGMEVVSDAGAIEKIVQDVIAANPKAVEDYKGGKTNVVGWLMGQVMKQSQGKANPKQATELLQKALAALQFFYRCIFTN